MAGPNAMVSQNSDIVPGLQHVLQTPKIPSVAPPLDLNTLAATLDVGQGGYARVGYAPWRTGSKDNSAGAVQFFLAADDTQGLYDEEQSRVLQAIVFVSLGPDICDASMNINNGGGGTVCDILRSPMVPMTVSGFTLNVSRPVYVGAGFGVQFDITAGGLASTCFIRGYALQSPLGAQVPSI